VVCGGFVDARAADVTPQGLCCWTCTTRLEVLAHEDAARWAVEQRGSYHGVAVAALIQLLIAMAAILFGLISDSPGWSTLGIVEVGLALGLAMQRGWAWCIALLIDGYLTWLMIQAAPALALVPAGALSCLFCTRGRFSSSPVLDRAP
jgi:hypothetical protein